MRSTKIVCTLGPATASPEGVLKLMKSGMNVARINFSHGNREQHCRTVRLIQTLSREHGYSSATLLDTKGSEIRTGDVSQPIPIRSGDTVVFSSKPLPHEKQQVIHVNYDGFAHDVRHAERILLDNGEMAFMLRQVRRDGSVVAEALDAGSIGSRRHVNLPGAVIGLPSITGADWKDLAVGVQEGVDFVGLSFIRSAADVRSVREFLLRRKSPMQIIAKIETRQAVENLAAIIEASDGVMVARGDLGAEIPYERIPAIQDDIVRRCRCAGKPVIVATHMLESMIAHPIPSRAEVTDVAHAAWTQADAVMLSGETAIGKHPYQALEAMSRILQETEKHIAHLPNAMDILVADELEARAEAAVALARFINAPAIFAFTRTGRTARALSKFRPRMPILAFTPNVIVQRQLQLSFGVRPSLMPFRTNPEQTLVEAMEFATKNKLMRAGQKVVIVSDALGKHGSVSTLQVRVVEKR